MITGLQATQQWIFAALTTNNLLHYDITMIFYDITQVKHSPEWNQSQKHKYNICNTLENIHE